MGNMDNSFFENFVRSNTAGKTVRQVAVVDDVPDPSDVPDFPKLRRYPLYWGILLLGLLVTTVLLLMYFHSRTEVILSAGFMEFANQTGGVEKASAEVGADWLPAALWVHDNIVLLVLGAVVVFGGPAAALFIWYSKNVRAYNQAIDDLIDEEMKHEEE